jgi:transposase-like protein
MKNPQITNPEFCPNSACPFHDRQLAATSRWFALFGTFFTRARGVIQRFRCTACGKTCSTQTFSVHYWTHSTTDLSWLLDELSTCSGMRQSGRVAGVTHRVIQNRHRRLARNALAVMDVALSSLNLSEHVAMDGFESFTASQYHPNNITHVCGCDSQFIYAAIHTLFRRRGAMTTRQRRRRAVIDSVWKPSTSITSDCGRLLADLAPRIDQACEGRRDPLELRSDEHRAYPPAIRSIAVLRERLKAGTLVHRTTSSRALRTTENPLFAVNYVDRQLRNSLAEYVRETMRHGREVNSQMERLAIFTVLHNFRTPHRISGHARTGDAATHAQVAGINDAEVTELLERMTTHRHVYTHHRSFQWWIKRIWLHLHENPPVVKIKKGVVKVREVCLGPGALPRHLLA